ncbi:MAG: UPF0262 family protein [Hyphomicrobiaceae bacterium]
MIDSPAPEKTKSRLVDIILDQSSIGHGNANVEHERSVAIFDLLEFNSFEVVGHDKGPYKLTLSIVETRLVLSIATEKDEEIVVHFLSLTPFKRIIKDYFAVCETYYEAIKTSSPSRIQAIDMGRRGLHDDGSRVLIERLEDKVVMDFDTARRLFTLITALHWKG